MINSQKEFEMFNLFIDLFSWIMAVIIMIICYPFFFVYDKSVDYRNEKEDKIYRSRN